jgi:Transposase domain (DUF772)
VASTIGISHTVGVQVGDLHWKLFADPEFVAVFGKRGRAFGKRGRPGWSPGRLALVTMLQMAENLTDRQAAEAVRTRIDWMYALGWAWTMRGSITPW